MERPPTPRKSEHQRTRWLVTTIALVGLLVGSLIVRALIILAPFIRAGLGIDESNYGYLNSALMFGSLITTLPIGFIVSRFSTRRAYGTILLVTGILLFVLSMQNTFVGMVILLFVVGISAAGIIPLANRVIAENFDPRKRGTITGFIFAAVPLGGFIGAVIFPVLGERYGWGAGYQVLGSISFIGSILSWTMLKDTRQSDLTSGGKLRWKEIGSQKFSFLAAVYGLFAFCMTSEIYYITLYLVDVVHVSAILAGTLFGLIQISAIGGRLFWGVLADRTFSKNRFWILSFTSGIMLFATLLLILLTKNSPTWLIVLNLIIFGVGGASSWGILSTLVGDVVGVSEVANATAAILFITNISDILGPMLFGNIIQLTSSYQWAFGVFMVLNVFVIAGFLSLAIRTRSSIRTS